MKRITLLTIPLSLFAISLLGVACTVPREFQASDGTEGEEVQKGMPVPLEDGNDVEEMMVIREEDGATEGGTYRSFTPDIIGNGEPSVLYFKADWCPKCVAQHAALSAAYDYPLSTYYLNYDTETELRSRYGVVTQHTFVKIDGEGEKIGTISFPSAEQLTAFLSE